MQPQVQVSLRNHSIFKSYWSKLTKPQQIKCNIRDSMVEAKKISTFREIKHIFARINTEWGSFQDKIFSGFPKYSNAYGLWVYIPIYKKFHSCVTFDIIQIINAIADSAKNLLRIRSQNSVMIVK